MQHLKSLTTQQFALAACGAFISAGAMFSQGSKLVFVPLFLAVLCGIGALVKAKANRAKFQSNSAGEA